MRQLRANLWHGRRSATRFRSRALGALQGGVRGVPAAARNEHLKMASLVCGCKDLTTAVRTCRMELAGRCYLCLPQGAASLWLHGRLLSAGSAAVATPERALVLRAPVSLVAVRAEEQNDCMCPRDGSYVVYDVGLLDHAGGRETVLRGVAMTGGTMARLCSENQASGNTDDRGAVAAAAADIAEHGGELLFEPDAAHVGARAARLMSVLFPDVHAALVDAGAAVLAASTAGAGAGRADHDDGEGEGAASIFAEAVVVEGQIRVSGATWTPLPGRQGAATLGGAARGGFRAAHGDDDRVIASRTDVDLSSDDDHENDGERGTLPSGSLAARVWASAAASAAAGDGSYGCSGISRSPSREGLVAALVRRSHSLQPLSSRDASAPAGEHGHVHNAGGDGDECGSGCAGSVAGATGVPGPQRGPPLAAVGAGHLEFGGAPARAVSVALLHRVGGGPVPADAADAEGWIQARRQPPPAAMEPH
jgi:hypothetical protein